MQISFVGTEQDFIAAQKTHAWRKYSPGSARAQRIIAPILGFVFIAVGLHSFWTERNSLGFALFVTLCGLYLISGLVFTPFYYRRAYRRRRSQEEQRVVYTLTEDYIACDCPGQTHTTAEWSVIKGTIASPTTILLYVSTANFLAIPKRALAEGQAPELDAILQQKQIPLGCPKPIRSSR